MNATIKRVLVIAAWISAVVGWVLYQRSTGLGTVGSLQQFIDTARGQWWALLVFVAVYSVRPVVLFPATLMTIAGGLLFGPALGIAATIVGANASAMTAYWLARSLGFEREQDPEAAGLLARWSNRMRNDSFETIMLMRLAFLPFDLVNYAAGLLRIRPVAFLLATAIGSVPGTISFTLAGASIESLEDGPSGIDPAVLVASLVLFVLSVGVSRYVKRREGLNEMDTQDETSARDNESIAA